MGTRIGELQDQYRFAPAPARVIAEYERLIARHNQAVDEHNEMVANSSALVDEYNLGVDEYNATLERAQALSATMARAPATNQEGRLSSGAASGETVRPAVPSLLRFVARAFTRRSRN